MRKKSSTTRNINYCTYCGRMAHRCDCGTNDSRLQRFLRRKSSGSDYAPQYRSTAYKRGVPPQIKRRERATLQKYYQTWYTQLVAQHGTCCLHCGTAEQLVIDHIIPVAKGGLSVYDNVQLLCHECNTLKGKLAYDCRS